MKPESDDLDSLAAIVAECQHEAWVRSHGLEGGAPGPGVDGPSRPHPRLTAWTDLPDPERAARRAQALAGLRAAVARGYRIERESASLAPATDPLTGDDLTDIEAVLAAWRAHSRAWLAAGPAHASALSQRLIQNGEPIVAHEILSDAERAWPGEPRLRQLRALALARCGAAASALAVVQDLIASGSADEETLGLEARLYKDQALAMADPGARAGALARAHHAYLSAFRRTGGYWTGINAACMALLCGRTQEAAALAAQVEDLCRRALDAAEGAGQAYWILATLGEAALIRGDLPSASEWYALATRAAGRKLGNIAATRRNARLICQRLGLDASRVDACLQVPAVAVCAGHMVDRPSRTRPRFPTAIESAVAEQIRGHLGRAGIGIGYASAACGTDILFLEAVLDLGGEIRVVLPYSRDRFVADSVDVIPGTNWRTRFERLMARATEVMVASDQGSAGDHASFDYVNRLLLGLSKDRALRLETRLLPLAVWNGEPGDAPGGTAAAVALWRATGHAPDIIDTTAILAAARPSLTDMAGSPSSSGAGDDHGVLMVAVLFADAVGFSKLTEERIPEFVGRFLGDVGRLAETAPHAPLYANTWGDGLVFVFRTVSEAGRFALDLAERTTLLSRQQPPDRPLPEVRIGLHAGPVYEFQDPVTRRPSYFGTHLTRAARIEPITPPGHVYASQAFAAMAALEQGPGFVCEYVGRIPLPKGHGVYPLYHVRPRSGVA